MLGRATGTFLAVRRILDCSSWVYSWVQVFCHGLRTHSGYPAVLRAESKWFVSSSLSFTLVMTDSARWCKELTTFSLCWYGLNYYIFWSFLILWVTRKARESSTSLSKVKWISGSMELRRSVNSWACSLSSRYCLHIENTTKEDQAKTWQPFGVDVRYFPCRHIADRWRDCETHESTVNMLLKVNFIIHERQKFNSLSMLLGVRTVLTVIVGSASSFPLR